MKWYKKCIDFFSEDKKFFFALQNNWGGRGGVGRLRRLGLGRGAGVFANRSRCQFRGKVSICLLSAGQVRGGV